MSDARENAARIHAAWHEAVRTGDLEGALALYADDAILESPLALPVFGDGSGIVVGKEKLRAFFVLGAAKLKGEFGRWRREPRFFTAGRYLTWEYPRETPDGDQFDLVEMMEIENGRIARHRVYWGRFGVQQLLAMD